MDINYIVDAKSEYTKQLQTLLVPRIYEGIESIYDDAKYNNTMNVLHTFQKLLREIPKWNKDIIDGETNRILEVTQCEWLDNLLTAVFVSNTKILTAIKIKDHDGKIDISIPRLSHFIHRCYIEVAREIYKNPYLLDKSITSVKEKQQNLRETLCIIENCIEDAIRSLLPIQSLLKEYLGNININKDKQIIDEEENNNDSDEEYDDIEEDLEGGEKIEKSKNKYKVNDLEEYITDNEQENDIDITTEIKSENKKRYTKSLQDDNDTISLQDDNDTISLQDDNDTKSLQDDNDTKSLQDDTKSFQDDTKSLQDDNDTKSLQDNTKPLQYDNTSLQDETILEGGNKKDIIIDEEDNIIDQVENEIDDIMNNNSDDDVIQEDNTDQDDDFIQEDNTDQDDDVIQEDNTDQDDDFIQEDNTDQEDNTNQNDQLGGGQDDINQYKSVKSNDESETKSIQTGIGNKELIKNIKIDNHLLPRSLQKKNDNIHEHKDMNTTKKVDDTIYDDTITNDSQMIQDDDTITNDSQMIQDDDTRSINSEFIRTGLKKIKKKKPKLILRKKIQQKSDGERPNTEGRNRYDFW